MANRHILAVNKLEDFKLWLIDNDWKIEPTKGTYEVLRARKETEKLPLIVYKRDKEGLVHLSVSDWNDTYVWQYINSKKQKAETAWAIRREDGLYFNILNEYIKDLYRARLSKTKEDAQSEIDYLCLKNCKPVKVEIKVARQ